MGSYSIAKSIEIAAPPARVHALIEDFRKWVLWSPWEGIDLDLRRSYSGPERGLGAMYSWWGNSKAGAGSMEIVECTPARVAIDLNFLKPFKSQSVSSFDLAQIGTGTLVTWTMQGQQSGLLGLIGKVIPMSVFIGKDFDKGLVQLKAAAEQSDS